MILVDIMVPSVDNNYDFQLDENSSIYNIIGEICELISHKEHCAINGNIEQLCLCDLKSNRVLSVNSTLRESQIKTGDSLMLV